MRIAHLVAIASALAALLSLLAVRWGRRTLRGRLAGEGPKGPRRPPRLGGLVVLGTTALVVGLFGPPLPEAWRPLVPWILAMYGLGFLDDVFDLPPRVKLLAQALICVALAAHVEASPLATPDGQGLALGALAVPVTVLGLLVAVNAFNMVDGADGLAGGLAVLTAGALALLAHGHGQPDLSVWLAAYAAAHGGFLLTNWAPARLYLGDAGSLGAGLVLALAGLLATRRPGGTLPVHTNALLFWLPVTEMTLTVGRRLIRGQQIFRGDVRHIHHLLHARGLRRDHVVAVLLALASLTTVAAVVSTNWRNLPVTLLILGLVTATLVGVLALGYVELRVLADRAVGFVRQSRRRGGTLVRVAEAAHRIRDARSWPEVARALEGLAEEGVLGEVVLDARPGRPLVEHDHRWTLEHDLGAHERPGYTLRVRARADGRGGLRPEDVRAYLVPALDRALDRLEGSTSAPAAESQEHRA